MAWFVYLLRCRDRSLYTGISTDVDARLKKHNAGTGSAYVRSRRPAKLVWKRKAASESAARKQEAEIKGWTKGKKESFVLRKGRLS